MPQKINVRMKATRSPVGHQIRRRDGSVLTLDRNDVLVEVWHPDGGKNPIDRFSIPSQYANLVEEDHHEELKDESEPTPGPKRHSFMRSLMGRP